jgi:type III secretory pathway component EscR
VIGIQAIPVVITLPAVAVLRQQFIPMTMSTEINDNDFTLNITHIPLVMDAVPEVSHIPNSQPHFFSIIIRQI